MIRSNKSCSPKRRYKEFVLFGNIIETKLPEYNSFQDPHMLNYFASRNKKNMGFRNIHLIKKIYNSHIKLSSIKSVPNAAPKLPKLVITRKEKKLQPITSEEFKEVLKKYRNNNAPYQEINANQSDRVFITSKLL